MQPNFNQGQAPIEAVALLRPGQELEGLTRIAALLFEQGQLRVRVRGPWLHRPGLLRTLDSVLDTTGGGCITALLELDLGQNDHARSQDRNPCDPYRRKPQPVAVGAEPTAGSRGGQQTGADHGWGHHGRYQPRPVDQGPDTGSEQHCHQDGAVASEGLIAPPPLATDPAHGRQAQGSAEPQQQRYPSDTELGGKLKGQGVRIAHEYEDGRMLGPIVLEPAGAYPDQGLVSERVQRLPPELPAPARAELATGVGRPLRRHVLGWRLEVAEPLRWICRRGDPDQGGRGDRGHC